MSISVKQKNPGWIDSLLGRHRATCGMEIAVGFPAGKSQAYPEDGKSVIEVAASHVFGIDVPQRDFMSYAQDGINQKTAPILQAIAKENSKDGDHSGAVKRLAEAAGMEGAQAIKDAILEGDYTPNSPRTIKRKGSNKPLIDTSHMINSTTFVVRERSK